MIFTSTAREDVNRSIFYDGTGDMRGSAYIDTVRPALYEPRPGYRAPQNLILAYFRHRRDGAGFDLDYFIDALRQVQATGDRQLARVMFDPHESGYLPEHADHALRVLERLTAWVPMQLDPAPWVNEFGYRFPDPFGGGLVFAFAPRPGYSQLRKDYTS